MKIITIICSLFVLFSSCDQNGNVEQNEIILDSIVSVSYLDTLKSNDIEDNEHLLISSYIGYVVASDVLDFGEFILLADAKGNIIDSITRFDEYSKVVLPCLSVNKMFYCVSNEDDTVYIKKNNPLVILQSWEEHILGLASVGFNHGSNPIRKQPANNARKIQFDENEFFFPLEIKGDWLRVEWGNPNNIKDGWIMWKDNDTLLIDFYYIM